MGFWLAPMDVQDLADKVKKEFHPHLELARIAVMFTDKRRVTGDKVILATAKKVSDEDKVLSRFDFKLVISAEDWGDLGPRDRKALLDHELSHMDVERVPRTENVGGRRKVVKDSYGRKIYTEEIKFNDDGNPKWKLKPHDFENFAHIVERYGIETASRVGGCFPKEEPEPIEEQEEIPKALASV